MPDELNAQQALLTWEESAAVLQTDAKHGIARAQRLLAMRYLRGRGVPVDQAIAFYWMQLAAQQHFSLAQRSLGELYERGSGIVLDITQASHWYRQHFKAIPSLKNICNAWHSQNVMTKKTVNPRNKKNPHDRRANTHR